MTTNFRTDFRRRFSGGLAAILPTVLTIALVLWLFQTIDRHIGRHINTWAKGLATWLWNLEKGTANEIWGQYHLNVIGFLLAIVLVYIVGLFVASFIGRTVWRSIERLLSRLPLIRQVYPSIKQVTDFLILSDGKPKFSRVVAVMYPRKGIWSVGLVTSPGMRSLQEKASVELLTIFIPSSPTPVTGYTITVRRDEVIDLPFSIDEALRFTISGGVIVPPNEALPRHQGHLGPEDREALSAQNDATASAGKEGTAKETNS